MIILDIPKEFQPNYKSIYPGYSSGKNMEEIFFEFFSKTKNEIETTNIEYIYLPVFWTSYYVTNNYAKNIDRLYNWLDQLDKTKNYFTIVQYASGIFVKNFDLNILVFSAGGGGLNINNNITTRELNYYGLNRSCFCGEKGDYDIPLMCLPLIPSLKINKSIFCSFMGRFDTHKCRIDMRNLLQHNNKFVFYESLGFEQYKQILNSSIFTLAPRGFGYTSFRIYEAIMADSIPIYIWDDKRVLPFSNKINWDDFSIIIHQNDIHMLPNILENTDITKMQNNLQKIKHLFTFEETFKYITNSLK
jgi:hypothetical protein